MEAVEASEATATKIFSSTSSVKVGMINLLKQLFGEMMTNNVNHMPNEGRLLLM